MESFNNLLMNNYSQSIHDSKIHVNRYIQYNKQLDETRAAKNKNI